MKKHSSWMKNLLPLLFVLLATLCGFVCQVFSMPEPVPVLLYVLAAVLWSVARPGMLQGMAASLVCMLCYNYFFIPPQFTFSVNQPAQIVTFALMCAVTLITSYLMNRILLAADRSESLYAFQKALAACGSEKQIQALLEKTLRKKLNGRLAKNEQILPVRTEGEESSFLDPHQFASSSWYLLLPLWERRYVDSLVQNASLAADRLVAAASKEQAMQDAIKEQERARLLQSVSHDIRTPLTRIILAAEQLQDLSHENPVTPVKDPTQPDHESSSSFGLSGLPEDQKKRAQSLCRNILEESAWLQKMTTHILQISRVEADPQSIRNGMEMLAAEEVIGSAIRLSELNHPGIKLDLSLPDHPVFVSMDASLIQQVLLNLIDNASRFAPDHTPVLVDVQEKEGKVFFSVSNYGPALSEEKLSHLFEPFHGNDRSSRHYGLGLAVCKTIVEAHGGTIQAENLQANGTVRFQFWLPEKAPAPDETE